MLNAATMGDANMGDLREVLGQDRLMKLIAQGGMSDLLTLRESELRRIMDAARGENTSRSAPLGVPCPSCGFGSKTGDMDRLRDGS
jgi:hypothetical protein